MAKTFGDELIESLNEAVAHASGKSKAGNYGDRCENPEIGPVIPESAYPIVPYMRGGDLRSRVSKSRAV